jgi:hypothetical protein
LNDNSFWTLPILSVPNQVSFKHGSASEEQAVDGNVAGLRDGVREDGTI